MDELFNYLVDLRSELHSILYGIEDSNYFDYWDDASPNRVTSGKINAVLNRFVREAEKFGVYFVTRHCDCPNPRHTRNANDGGMGYVVADQTGKKIKYKDRFVWTVHQLYQGDRLCKCPCSNNNTETLHHVIDEFIIYVNSRTEKCEAIASILCDIATARDNAANRHPRSGIREYLLWAIIEINDQILPQSVDSYISDHT